MGVTWDGNCSLCARSVTGTRPPTADEKRRSSCPGMNTETNYARGIYKARLSDFELKELGVA